MPRKLLKTYGSHGRSARVFTERGLVRVQWREGGKRKTESWPETREHIAEAKAFAQGLAERLARPVAAKADRLTVHALGDKFLLAHPVPETWRPKTLATFLARWKVWRNFIAPDTWIDLVTPETIDSFRAAMRKQGYAVNQVANHVQMVKSVWRFARERGYLAVNPLAEYRMKLSRDQRKMVVPEYTPDECGRILAELREDTARGWRPCVAIRLDALLGVRSNALLHLEWRDVDLVNETVTWRPELDKLGKHRVQPLPPQAVEAFKVAIVWRAATGYDGPFVFPSAQKRRRGKAKPWTYQALNQALHEAAKRAGVPWVKYRAMHGLRRMALNNARALMKGDLAAAGQWIGDTDLRTLSNSYVRERPEEMRGLAGQMVLPEAPPKLGSPVQPNDNGHPMKDGRGGVES